MPKFGYQMDSIVSVHQLVSNAIILTGQETEDEDAAPNADAADAAAAEANA
jgi:hypothetical protein